MYPAAVGDPQAAEFAALLRIPLAATNYPLVGIEKSLPNASVNIRTRSLAAVLRLLSFGVDPYVNAKRPDGAMDTQSEVWESLVRGAGSVNLGEQVRGIFRIHWTSRPPTSSDLSVRFRGSYFWIDSNDRSSVRIFSLIRDLFDLQVTSTEEAKPVLTIPVGQ